jgi:RNA polymerase sigma factor (sigma-70 family)
MEPDERDEVLVQAARNGDRVAFGVLLTRHRPLLLAVCRRALGDDGLAEDAAQEASLQALLTVARLRRPERFGSWLAGIGLNICHRWRRSRAREAFSWEAVVGGRIVVEPVDETAGPDELAAAAELRRWIEQAVAALPPGQRAAVMLHYLDGLTQAETAALLGIEVGAVKTRLHKARAGLRRNLTSATEFGAKKSEDHAMIEMKLSDVRRRRTEDGTPRHHVVILEEIDGPRRLPIWIGEAEATAMALQLEKVGNARPLTYAFVASLLEAAGGHLREVRIDRLDGNVFIATTVVDGPDGAREIDSRPSDALNLALLLSAPIHVDLAVLAATEGVEAPEVWSKLDEMSDRAAVIVAEVQADWAQACLGQASDEA